MNIFVSWYTYTDQIKKTCRIHFFFFYYVGLRNQTDVTLGSKPPYSLSSSPPPYSLKQGLTEPGAHQFGWTGWLASSKGLHLPSAEIGSYHSTQLFHMSAGNETQVSGLYNKHSSNKPFPQLLHIFYVTINFSRRITNYVILRFLSYLLLPLSSIATWEFTLETWLPGHMCPCSVPFLRLLHVNVPSPPSTQSLSSGEPQGSEHNYFLVINSFSAFQLSVQLH